MANLKEVRNRIASVGSTMQITSAMKMVSASKLRRAQNSIIALRPYSALLSEIISKIMGDDTDLSDSDYGKKKKLDKVLLVVLTSNKGLCGGFNANIIKATKKRVEEIYKQDKYIKVDILSFGRKSTEFFRKQKGIEFAGDGDSIWDNLDFEHINKIAEDLMNKFKTGNYSQIEIIYNQFKNSASQIVTDEIFLPIQTPTKQKDKKSSSEGNLIFEPSVDILKESIIPQALKNQLFKCFIDSFASEHGARMTAMHKATDNAQGLLKELKLSYNKARQAAITNEIIEICSGAEALNE
ncbi:MAG: atpG [Bacteroidetes bacterium]|nr:atpG [Bacteroidota bacterium]